jgi:hypothetical protein
MAVLGLVGGGFAVVAATGELFGLYQQVSAGAGLATLPEAGWEASLGVWLTVKGFRAAPIVAQAALSADVSR